MFLFTCFFQNSMSLGLTTHKLLEPETPISNADIFWSVGFGLVVV